MSSARGRGDDPARPAHRALRVILVVLAVAGAVVLLFTVVFPWFDATFVNDPVLGGAGAGPLPHGD